MVTSLVAALLLSAGPGQDSGSVPLGSRIPRKVEELTAPEKDAVKILHRFSQCIAKSKRPGSLVLLATEYNSPQQESVVRRLIGSSTICLRDASKMRLTSTLFRGGIAEALYRTDYPYPPALPEGRTHAPEDARGDPVLVLNAFVRCVAARDTGGVDKLLRTAPGSDEERVAINALNTNFAPCALEGQKLELNTLTLRAALAEAQYNWVRSAWPATAGR